MTQNAIIGKLLQRKRGVTSYEMIVAARTVSPSKRVSELRSKGWTITKIKCGERYHRFFGKPPCK